MNFLCQHANLFARTHTRYTHRRSCRYFWWIQRGECECEMFGGGVGGSDSTPAIWKMEYVMENRLKRLIEGSESRTNSVTEEEVEKAT